MFGWLRRRLEREHAKLVYQNCAAAEDGELKIYVLVNGGTPEHLEEMLFASQDHRAHIRSGKKLSHKQIEIALELNKNLRRLYDQNARKGRGSFDDVYQPLGGWSGYFERNGYMP